MSSKELCPKKYSCSMDAELNQLTQHMNKTVEQCRRFEEIASVLGEWTTKWPTSALSRWLVADELDNMSREMALVALVLKASAEAGAAIKGYTPVGRGTEHRLFHHVARFEWERRYRDAGEGQYEVVN